VEAYVQYRSNSVRRYSLELWNFYCNKSSVYK